MIAVWIGVGLYVVFLIALAIEYAREAAFWRRVERERRRRR